MDYRRYEAGATRDRYITLAMVCTLATLIAWPVFAATLAVEPGTGSSPELRVGLTLGAAVVVTVLAAVFTVVSYLQHLHLAVMARLQDLDV